MLKCIEINLFTSNDYIAETKEEVELSFKLEDSTLQDLANQGKLAIYTIHNGKGKLITVMKGSEELNKKQLLDRIEGTIKKYSKKSNDL